MPEVGVQLPVVKLDDVSDEEREDFGLDLGEFFDSRREVGVR